MINNFINQWTNNKKPCKFVIWGSNAPFQYPPKRAYAARTIFLLCGRETKKTITSPEQYSVASVLEDDSHFRPPPTHTRRTYDDDDDGRCNFVFSPAHASKRFELKYDTRARVGKKNGQRPSANDFRHKRVFCRRPGPGPSGGVRLSTRARCNNTQARRTRTVDIFSSPSPSPPRIRLGPVFITHNRGSV